MRFPKAVALTAFVVYALTVNRGMTLTSLPMTAKVTGWDWLPMTSQPMTWLLTLPLRLLPADWVPCGLNLISAALAALTLGLLARVVELLPWDCAPDAKQPWIAKLPAVLAVAVCGFEFSFWQDATAGTGEMVGLLLFALAGWCLLEYRVEREMRWLNAAALVWGLGMAENWLMLAALPLFVAALIALRGMRFFKTDFVVRMALLGLAGFSSYALLPLANWLEPHSPWSFSESWSATFHATKNTFHLLYYDFWVSHQLLGFAVLLYFLVPVLPCFVRLKNQGANNLSQVDRFQAGIYRGLRAVLLLACLWLAFDPEVGPREIVRQQLGFTMPMLTFDLVNALGIAFMAGNLLYASQIPPKRRSRSGLQKLNSLLRRNTPGLLAGLSLVVVGGLLVRNLPAIVLIHRQPLSGFGRLMASSLPADGGIVLGDDAIKLTVLQAALAGDTEGRRWHVVNLRYLSSLQYRAALERRFPAGWTAASGAAGLKPIEALRLIDGLARTNRIFFLQPHNGEIIYEHFQPVPAGGMHELKRYPEKHLEVSRPTPEQIADVEKFWDGAWHDGLEDLSQTDTREFHLESSLKRHLAIAPVARDQSSQLGRWYSAALNDWGVVLQQNGRLAAAQKRFEQALALNTNNVAAAANLDDCTNLLAGKKLNLAGAAQVPEKFRSLQQLEQLIRLDGEIDDPGTRCVLGNAWLEAGWARQAWVEFDHAKRLAREAVAPQLAMAQIASRFRQNDEVFAAVRRLRPFVTNSPAGQTLEIELAMLEAKAWMSETNPAEANKVLNALLQAHPGEQVFTDEVFKAYLALGEADGAMQIVDAELAKDPDNIAALNNRAALLIQKSQAAAAIPALDHALSLTNLPAIRLNRAIAYMQATNPAAAEKDYALLEDTTADQFSVHYGLAQIALGRQDTNAAVRELGLCLANTPPEGAKAREVHARLDALAH